MTKRRVIVLLMDSFGVGAAPDAAKYGDSNANTFGHIAEKTRLDLALPNLQRRGLVRAAEAASGRAIAGFSEKGDINAVYGYAAEQSFGKDTPSGHWEIMGVPVLFDWGYFTNSDACFPPELLAEFIAHADLPGTLGNKHASGTVILEELGEEHIKTGKPIVYTSADSVFQIAAHETHFGLQRLYDICLIARDLVDDYNIGRVIARPFIGEAGSFTRTANRHDYSTPPPSPTLLPQLIEQGGRVIAIGKTADIFAHIGISESIPAPDNMALFDATLQALASAPDKSLIFTNFVDFDSKYGHRRDVDGYANALIEFDKRLPELDAMLQEGDMVVITADHGCDPTQPGSDHTREFVPFLAYGPGIATRELGRCETFADIGQSIAYHLEVKPLATGTAFQQR